MPKMICVPCEIELKPAVNGALIIEHAAFGPYKLWYADVWKCPNCGHHTVAGFAHSPLMEHFEEGFAEFMEKAVVKAELVVNDYEHPYPKGS